MSREVFLDTNGWFALLNSADALHADAGRLTDWVIAESGNGLAGYYRDGMNSR
jgi:hypothetical protein